MKALPKALPLTLLLLALLLWLYGRATGQAQWEQAALWIGDALAMAGAYLIPTITAALVRCPRLKTVALLNVLGGWLILPWIAAMALAIKRDDLQA